MYEIFDEQTLCLAEVEQFIDTFIQFSNQFVEVAI